MSFSKLCRTQSMIFILIFSHNFTILGLDQRKRGKKCRFFLFTSTFIITLINEDLAIILTEIDKETWNIKSAFFIL